MNLATHARRLVTPVGFRLARKNLAAVGTTAIQLQQCRTLKFNLKRFQGKGPGGADASEMYDPELEGKEVFRVKEEDVLALMKEEEEAIRKGRHEQLRNYTPPTFTFEDPSAHIDWAAYLDSQFLDLINIPAELKGIRIQWDYNIYPPFFGDELDKKLEQPSQKVTALFDVEQLKLTENQLSWFKQIVGGRYDPKKKSCRVVCDVHPTKEENFEQLKTNLITLFAEVKKVE